MLVKGRVLFESMLENVPVLERGALATLIVYSKNMSISMPVVACESAGIGQKIKVKNETTDKYYRAIVKNNATVLMRL
jgi:flagella basal body P-ring formation protein FlgA